MSAIWRSPPTGGKHVCSERERSSQACIPADDAPWARRFRLPFLFFGRGGAIHPTKEEEEWRGLRSRRAGRWFGSSRRTLAFGAMSRSSGSRPSFDDGRDLATRLGLENRHLRYLRDLWATCDGWLAFVSSCLRCLCVPLCVLCASVVLLVFAEQRGLVELARDEVAGAYAEETD